MSIHDVSKDHDQRLTPKPNTGDSLSQRPAHGTNSVNYKTDAQTASSRILGGIDRLVDSGVVNHTVSVPASGALSITTTTVPHGLPYAPSARASLNNSTINGNGSFNIPLPFTPSVAADTTGPAEHLDAIVYLFYATDATNFYVISYSSAAALPVTYKVTYYLYQQVIG